MNSSTVLVVVFGILLIGACSYVLFFQEQAPFSGGAIEPIYVRSMILFAALIGGIILISLVRSWLQRKNKGFS